MWDTGRGKRHLVQAQWEVTEKEACDPGLFAMRRTGFLFGLARCGCVSESTPEGLCFPDRMTCSGRGWWWRWWCVCVCVCVRVRVCMVHVFSLTSSAH